MLVTRRSSHLECGSLKTIGAVHLEAGGKWHINHSWVASQEPVTVSMDEGQWRDLLTACQLASAHAYSPVGYFGCFYILWALWCRGNLIVEWSVTALSMIHYRHWKYDNMLAERFVISQIPLLFCCILYRKNCIGRLRQSPTHCFPFICLYIIYLQDIVLRNRHLSLITVFNNLNWVICPLCLSTRNLGICPVHRVCFFFFCPLCGGNEFLHFACIRLDMKSKSA